jgi:hypothetical protein
MNADRHVRIVRSKMSCAQEKERVVKERLSPKANTREKAMDLDLECWSWYRLTWEEKRTRRDRSAKKHERKGDEFEPFDLGG